MKKRIIISLALFIILILCGCNSNPQNGLVYNPDAKQTWYYINGEVQHGWQEINGNWYYFYDWHCEPCYFTPMNEPSTGQMIANGYITYDGEKYFFDSKGRMITNQKVKDENGVEYSINDMGVAKCKQLTKKQLDVFNNSIVGETWTGKSAKWRPVSQAEDHIIFFIEYDENDDLQKDIANKVIVYANAKDLDFYDCLLDGYSDSYRKREDKFTKLYDIELYDENNKLYDKTTISELSTDGLHFYYHSGSVLIDRREVKQIIFKFVKKY